MQEMEALEIARSTVVLLLKVSLPILVIALLVGLAISLFQALTQIQEPTLSFVPKIVAIFVTILLSMNFVGSSLSHFNDTIMSMIVRIE